MSLKKLFKVLKDEGIVIPKLNRYLLAKGDDEDRKHGMNSPSGVSSCILSQYMLRTGVKRNSIIEPRTQRIFDNGTYFHIRTQDYLKKEGILLIDETPVWNIDLNILGHCDGLLKISSTSLAVLELKSINTNGFSQLRQAKPEHIMQAQVYMYCLEHMRKLVQGAEDDEDYEAIKNDIMARYQELQESFVTDGKKFTKEEKVNMKMIEMGNTLDVLYSCLKPIDTMSLVYENKNDQELKEFIVKWDDKLVEFIQERYTTINKAVEEGIKPPRPDEATSKSCQFCRFCSYQFDCWH